MSNEHLSEKISVNVNSSVLSSIDLLIDHGYYSNRSDFFNQALRESLNRHSSTIDRIASQNSNRKCEWFLGVYGIARSEIEEKYKNGEHCSIYGYGVLTIADDIPEEMLFSVVEKITIKGKVYASESIKKHYNLK